MSPLLKTKPTFDPLKDLEPISPVAVTAFAIAVHPSVPANNLKELVAYVKANPGKMSYGSAGHGSLNHLAGELFKLKSGLTDVPHVPYRGAGPGLTDLLAGQIPALVPAMTNIVLEHHKAGKLRILAVTNARRLASCEHRKVQAGSAQGHQMRGGIPADQFGLDVAPVGRPNGQPVLLPDCARRGSDDVGVVNNAAGGLSPAVHLHNGARSRGDDVCQLVGKINKSGLCHAAIVSGSTGRANHPNGQVLGSLRSSGPRVLGSSGPRVTRP